MKKNEKIKLLLFLTIWSYSLVGMNSENIQPNNLNKESQGDFEVLLRAIEEAGKFQKKERRKYDTSRRFGVSRGLRGPMKKKSTIVLRNEVPKNQRPQDWSETEYIFYQKNSSDIYIGCDPENVKFTCLIDHACTLPIGIGVNFKELYEHYEQSEPIKNGFCFEKLAEKCEVAGKKMKKIAGGIIEHCCLVHHNMTKGSCRKLKEYFGIKRKKRQNLY